MVSKCRKWHLREPKFAKFPVGACPRIPLEAHAFGAPDRSEVRDCGKLIQSLKERGI